MRKFLFLLLLIFTLSACKKGKGAICNDGTRSYSTGRGTCSWHGGVKYYVDPEEISVGRTLLLLGAIGITGYLFIINKKD